MQSRLFRSFSSPPSFCLLETRAHILCPLMGVKASYKVGFKSTQAWSCPLPMLAIKGSILTSSQLPPLPSPFLVLSLFLLVIPFFNIWEKIRWHSSSLGWKAVIKGVDNEIRWSYNQLQHRVPHHTPRFSLNTAAVISWSTRRMMNCPILWARICKPLRSPGIDSQLGGMVRQPYLS